MEEEVPLRGLLHRDLQDVLQPHRLFSRACQISPPSCVKEQLRPNLDRLGLPRCWVDYHRLSFTTRGEQHTAFPVRYRWHGLVGCGIYPPWAKTVYAHMAQMTCATIYTTTILHLVGVTCAGCKVVRQVSQAKIVQLLPSLAKV